MKGKEKITGVNFRTKAIRYRGVVYTGKAPDKVSEKLEEANVSVEGEYEVAEYREKKVKEIVIPVKQKIVSIVEPV